VLSLAVWFEPGDLGEMFLEFAALTGGLLIASAFMMRWIEKRPFAAIGLPVGKETWRGWLQGAAIGAAFMALVVVVQTVVGWLRPAPDAGTVMGWLGVQAELAAMFAIAAAAEELLLRGYAFQLLVEAMGAWPAVIITSVLFALVHLGNPNVDTAALVNIGLAGVILAGAYLRTRSLWVAIGLHWAWNWVMAGWFDLPVSGLEFDVPGYDTVERGPDAFTGGVFGPEAGIVLTFAALILIVWIYRTPALKETPEMATRRPLVDSRLRRNDA
jgi:membrane protease YdiL (CAAX protease family)